MRANASSQQKETTARTRAMDASCMYRDRCTTREALACAIARKRTSTELRRRQTGAA
jgi:hypothetical protein